MSGRSFIVYGLWGTGGHRGCSDCYYAFHVSLFGDDNSDHDCADYPEVVKGEHWPERSVPWCKHGHRCVDATHPLAGRIRTIACVECNEDYSVCKGAA